MPTDLIMAIALWCNDPALQGYEKYFMGETVSTSCKQAYTRCWLNQPQGTSAFMRNWICFGESKGKPVKN